MTMVTNDVICQITELRSECNHLKSDVMESKSQYKDAAQEVGCLLHQFTQTM